MAGSDSLYIVKDRLQGFALVPHNAHNGPGVECDSLSTWRKEGKEGFIATLISDTLKQSFHKVLFWP